MTNDTTPHPFADELDARARALDNAQANHSGGCGEDDCPNGALSDACWCRSCWREEACRECREEAPSAPEQAAPRPCTRCKGAKEHGPWGDSDHYDDTLRPCNWCKRTGIEPEQAAPPMSDEEYEMCLHAPPGHPALARALREGDRRDKAEQAAPPLTCRGCLCLGECPRKMGGGAAPSQAPLPLAQGYAVDGPRPRRFVVDGWTSKDTSEAATLKEAREAADLWRDAFGGTVRELAGADEVMRKLSAELHPGSRRQVAQLMIRIMAMAAYPAKLIAVSPLPRGYLPKKGSRKAMAYLYPDEDARLAGSAEVPLCFRVLYAFLHREGMRAGEAARLDWADVDLERGAIKLDDNKTDDPRAWALNGDVARALKAWKELRRLVKPSYASPKAAVFVQDNGLRVNVDRGASTFRQYLAAAGLDRPELFERTAKRQPIRLHDTRATFITINLANGKSDTWVKDRTGHKSSQMLELYRRQARALAELDLGPLMPMDTTVPELRGKPQGGELGELAAANAVAGKVWDAMDETIGTEHE